MVALLLALGGLVMVGAFVLARRLIRKFPSSTEFERDTRTFHWW